MDFDGSSEATFAADHIFSKYQPASPFRTNQGVRIVALERKDLEENVDGKRQTLSNALVDIIKEDEKNGLVSKGQNVSFAGGYDADERASNTNPGSVAVESSNEYPDVVYLLRNFPSSAEEADQVCFPSAYHVQSACIYVKYLFVCVSCLPACLPACNACLQCLPAMPACNACLQRLPATRNQPHLTKTNIRAPFRSCYEF